MTLEFACERCKRSHTTSATLQHVVCICGHFISVPERPKRVVLGRPSPEAIREINRSLDHPYGASRNSPVPPTYRCGAVQCSDTMYCQGCGLQWDVNDPEPPECLLERKGAA